MLRVAWCVLRIDTQFAPRNISATGLSKPRCTRALHLQLTSLRRFVLKAGLLLTRRQALVVGACAIAGYRQRRTWG